LLKKELHSCLKWQTLNPKPQITAQVSQQGATSLPESDRGREDVRKLPGSPGITALSTADESPVLEYRFKTPELEDSPSPPPQTSGNDIPDPSVYSLAEETLEGKNPDGTFGWAPATQEISRATPSSENPQRHESRRSGRAEEIPEECGGAPGQLEGNFKDPAAVGGSEEPGVCESSPSEDGGGSLEGAGTAPGKVKESFERQKPSETNGMDKSGEGRMEDGKVLLIPGTLGGGVQDRAPGETGPATPAEMNSEALEPEPTVCGEEPEASGGKAAQRQTLPPFAPLQPHEMPPPAAERKPAATWIDTISPPPAEEPTAAAPESESPPLPPIPVAAARAQTDSPNSRVARLTTYRYHASFFSENVK
jgi:hypothetical protein